MGGDARWLCIRSIKDQIRHKIMISSMGISRALAESELYVPTRWKSLFEPLQTSSDLVYMRLCTIDGEAEDDLKRIEKKIGTRRLYDEDEVKELRDKIEDIRIDV